MLTICKISKDQVKQIVLRARESERKKTIEEMEILFDREIQKIEGQHALELQDKQAEIDMLNRQVSRQDKYIDMAEDKIIQSKKIYLRAKEIAILLETEFKKHSEHIATSMTQFNNIREDSEIFSKKLIEGKLDRI